MDRREQQRETIKAEAARRGIKVTQRGQAYLLQGIGVSLLCADLASLSEADLQPFIPRNEKQAHG